MKPTRIRTAVAVLATTVMCSGTLAGCSMSKGEEPDDPGNAGASTSASSEPSSSSSPTQGPSASPSPSFSASPSVSPTVSPSPSTPPSPSGTLSTPAPAATIERALLTAAEMPQISSTSAWAQRRTGPLGSKPFGLCQKFDLLSIGAVSGVERTFVTGGGTAAQQVAEFPDPKNTVRAGKVVEAWHRDCAGRVRGSGVKVRPIAGTPVSHGKGWSYLVSYERNGRGQFHSLGVVVSGARMTLVGIDHQGQDHNYDVGRDPMELAVKAASSKMG